MSRTAVKPVRLSEEERERYAAAALAAGKPFAAWAREAMEAWYSGSAGSAEVRGLASVAEPDGDGLPEPIREDGSTALPPALEHHPLCKCRGCVPPVAA